METDFEKLAEGLPEDIYAIVKRLSFDSRLEIYEKATWLYSAELGVRRDYQRREDAARKAAEMKAGDRDESMLKELERRELARKEAAERRELARKEAAERKASATSGQAA